MSLADEVTATFDKARAEIAKKTTPPGVLPSESDPDPTSVAINANFTAVFESLLLLANEIDGLKSQKD